MQGCPVGRVVGHCHKMDTEQGPESQKSSKNLIVLSSIIRTVNV